MINLNYFDLLTDDLIEKILDISLDDYDNQISLLNDKMKTIEDLLEPLSSYYDEEEDITIINYDNITYSLEYNLFDRIYENNMIIINKYNEFFSTENVDGGDYISNELNNPSYFDILLEANKAVIYTGDYHHTFFEGINKIDKEDVYEYFGIIPKDNYNYYEFMLGS